MGDSPDNSDSPPWVTGVQDDAPSAAELEAAGQNSMFGEAPEPEAEAPAPTPAPAPEAEPVVLKILSGASAIIAEGEVDQLTAQRKIDTSEERYLHIIRAKTAALFAAASRIAAVVAECSEEEEQALDEYGRNLGVAFQLVDDALDYDSDAAQMGKDRGDDFREGKMTLPVILAYARGDESEREFWKAAIAGFRTSDDDLDEAVLLIDRHNAVADTKARARHFAQRAIDALSIFPDGKARLAMTQAALFAVSRGY